MRVKALSSLSQMKTAPPLLLLQTVKNDRCYFKTDPVVSVVDLGPSSQGGECVQSPIWLQLVATGSGEEPRTKIIVEARFTLKV
jgi:hypothetical protein